jgi:hypothetical protein
MRLPVVVLLPTLALVAMFAGPARAESVVHAVLPTKSSPAAVVDAELAAMMMRVTLQERGVVLVPASAVATAVAANQTACGQSPVACARLVGRATGAARVVASELFDDGGVLELRVVVVEVGTTGDPGPWRSFAAADRATLGVQAQQAAVQVVLPTSFFGLLAVKMAPGAEILVDGVARDRTPLFSPIELSVGRHEVEVRAGRLVPWRGHINIGIERVTTITLCAPRDAITDKCGPPPSAPSPLVQMREPLLYGGLAAAGLGAIGIVGGSVAAGNAARAQKDFAEGDVSPETRDEALGAQSVAIACFVVGGLAFVGGVVAAAVSTIVE